MTNHPATVSPEVRCPAGRGRDWIGPRPARIHRTCSRPVMLENSLHDQLNDDESGMCPDRIRERAPEESRLTHPCRRRRLGGEKRESRAGCEIGWDPRMPQARLSHDSVQAKCISSDKRFVVKDLFLFFAIRSRSFPRDSNRRIARWKRTGIWPSFRLFCDPQISLPESAPINYPVSSAVFRKILLFGYKFHILVFCYCLLGTPCRCFSKKGSESPDWGGIYQQRPRAELLPHRPMGVLGLG